MSIALIGAGRIGTHHAAAIAHDVHTAELVAVVDPRIDVAGAFADDLGARAEATRGAEVAVPTGQDGVRALEIARAAILSVQQHRTVALTEVAR